MKQNETRLEYKTPREITDMDRKMSTKDCSEVKQVAVSKLQEKQYLVKQQRFDNKITWIYSPLLGITSPFIRLLIFSFVLQR